MTAWMAVLGATGCSGGAGNDTFQVNSSADVTIELAGEGLDTVVTTIGLTMAAHVEYARMAGNAGFVHGNGLDNWVQGNARDNLIHGNGGNDAIYAGAGNDQLYGGDGNDILGGGAGNDTFTGGLGSDRFLGEAGDDLFVFSDGEGTDYVGNFTNGGAEADVISLAGIAAIADYTALVSSHMFQFGADVRIDLGGGNVIWLTFTNLADLAADNFLF